MAKAQAFVFDAYGTLFHWFPQSEGTVFEFFADVVYYSSMSVLPHACPCRRPGPRLPRARLRCLPTPARPGRRDTVSIRFLPRRSWPPPLPGRHWPAVPWFLWSVVQDSLV